MRDNLVRYLVVGLALSAASPAQPCPAELPTILRTNGGGAVGGAVYFDLAVTNPVTITALCVNTSQAVGNPIGLTVYTNNTVPTYAGNESDPNWMQVAIDDGTAVAAPIDTCSLVQLLAPLTLAPGVYPMALVATGNGGSFNHRYTNGNGSNQSYADADLRITLGSSSNVPFSPTIFRPRVWNGSFRYLSTDSLAADFRASASCGGDPLTVTFTDLSCSTDPGGITSWRWDFGDGTSSTVPSPTHVFRGTGCRVVTLTVTDASHPPASKSAPVCVVGNDECAGAVAIGPGRHGPFTNRCATDSLPPMPCGGAAANDVWFTYFHAGADAMLVVETCTGTDFDSKIEVLAGSCGQQSSIACNDDACGLQSRVTWAARQGVAYFIRVGGFAGATGEFQVRLGVIGAFAVVQPGCGGNRLVASSSSSSGLPEIGSDLTFTMTPAVGTAQVTWIGPAATTPVAWCPACIQVANMAYLLPAGPRTTVAVPNARVLCGAGFRVQGADLGAVGGCDFGFVRFTLSDAIEVLLGC